MKKHLLVMCALVIVIVACCPPPPVDYDPEAGTISQPRCYRAICSGVENLTVFIHGVRLAYQNCADGGLVYEGEDCTLIQVPCSECECVNKKCEFGE